MDDHHVALAEVLDPQRRQPGLVAQREVHDRHPVRLRKRLGQQHIGFRRFGVGLQKIAAVEQHRIHVAGRHELQHFDLAAAFFGQRGDVVVGDDDHLAVIGFVGPGDVTVFDDFAVHLAHALVSDSAVVLGVHLVELDVVVLGGAVHLDRDVHQPERDGTLPDGAHVSQYAHTVRCLTAPAPPRRCSKARARNATARLSSNFRRGVTSAGERAALEDTSGAGLLGPAARRDRGGRRRPARPSAPTPGWRLVVPP